MYMEGFRSAQRPSQDERVLAQLSPEDRQAVAGMDPDQADAALKDMFPDWSPKINPFPTSMMGTREREGDARIGWMPWAIDNFNYSPFATEDIAAFFGPDSPETVRRDIDAWKGGSSSLDRTVTEAVGGSSKDLGPPTQNPFVDPVEYGALGITMGVPGILGSAVRGGRRAAGIGRKALDRFKPAKRPSRELSDVDDVTAPTVSAGQSVRDDLNKAFAADRSRVQRKAR
jgi:hypothetical protein